MSNNQNIQKRKKILIKIILNMFGKYYYILRKIISLQPLLKYWQENIGKKG